VLLHIIKFHHRKIKPRKYALPIGKKIKAKLHQSQRALLHVNLKKSPKLVIQLGFLIRELQVLLKLYLVVLYAFKLDVLIIKQIA